MANPLFNPELDKITEREVVYDFVSRIRIGKPFTDPDDETVVIFSPPTLNKDIMRKTVMALPKSIAYNLDNIHTKFTQVTVGTTSVKFTLPTGCTKLILAYSERTQTDYTSLFTKSGNTYTLTTDVAFEACPDPNNELYNSSIADIIKFYCI